MAQIKTIAATIAAAGTLWLIPAVTYQALAGPQPPAAEAKAQNEAITKIEEGQDKRARTRRGQLRRAPPGLPAGGDRQHAATHREQARREHDQSRGRASEGRIGRALDPPGSQVGLSSPDAQRPDP